MKIIHLPTSVGGQAWHLAQAEKLLGFDSTVLTQDSNYLNYPADIQLDMQGHASSAKFLKLFKAFLDIRSGYDIYHFNWGTSLLTSRSLGLTHLDLPFYPDSAKLFVTYNGCDARQKFPTIQRGGISACAECQVKQCDSGRLDGVRQRGIEKMSRYVQHSWALNPDILNFLPTKNSSFLPYAVPVTNKLPQWPSLNGPLKIVHAPTNRDIKGTHHLLHAVSKLDAKFPGEVELVLVEGLSHAEALKQYAEADLVVDQLLVGWYGGFAVEAMLLGKPVVVRIEENDLKFIQPDMARDLKHAVINTGPVGLYDTLLQCLGERDKLQSVARAGYEYALKWHAPRYVASLVIEKYNMASA